jgi:hypothetical protein
MLLRLLRGRTCSSSCRMVGAVSVQPARQTPPQRSVVSDSLADCCVGRTIRRCADLRPELGVYGGKAITPNVDKLASSPGAVVFERSYVQQAICCPTRSSFLTGRRPDTTKVWDLHTHFRASGGEFTTLPQYFLENGWYTMGMGKVRRASCSALVLPCRSAGIATSSVHHADATGVPSSEGSRHRTCR